MLLRKVICGHFLLLVYGLMGNFMLFIGNYGESNFREIMVGLLDIGFTYQSLGFPVLIFADAGARLAIGGKWWNFLHIWASVQQRQYITPT